jgi:hypothetical protein
MRPSAAPQPARPRWRARQAGPGPARGAETRSPALLRRSREQARESHPKLLRIRPEHRHHLSRGIRRHLRSGGHLSGRSANPAAPEWARPGCVLPPGPVPMRLTPSPDPDGKLGQQFRAPGAGGRADDLLPRLTHSVPRIPFGSLLECVRVGELPSTRRMRAGQATAVTQSQPCAVPWALPSVISEITVRHA